MTDRLLGIKKDDLTNCYMKNGIYPFLQMLIDEYPTARKPFSVLLLDLDYFKTYNDTYGHLIGDEILKYFASSVRLDLYGLENVAFRFGGDEFVIVFPGRLPIEVYPLVMRLRDNIRTRQCLIKGNQIKLSFSAGIASYPTDGKSIEELMENADKAMYQSKKKGRNRATIYSKIWPDNKRLAYQIGAGASGALVLGLLAFYWADINQFLTSDRFHNQLIHVQRVILTAKDKVSQRMAAFQKPMVDVNPLLTSPTAAETGTPPAAPPAPAPAPAAPSPAAAPLREIHLRSGGIIRGTVVSETPDELRVRISVGEGQGMLKVKRSDILQIDDAV